MKVKQREQRGAASQMTLLSLQKNLLQVWENLNVDQYYQNLILSYVDSLPGHEAQSLIAKEIKATHEGSSQYFKIAERLSNRKKELSELSNLIRISEPRSGINSETLSGASDLLNELRDHNLAVAEMLINLHRQYNSGEQNSVSDECMQMFLDLDSDNSFLKDSFLNQFVLFQQGYDPFFLYHYDMKGKKAPPISHPIIDQLFNLNISYACRLFKAKTRVLEILSSGTYNETKLFKRKSKNYEASSPKRLSTEMPASEELRTIDRDEDRKRETSSNFKVRKVLSLQKAKEKERKRSIDRDSTFQKQRPIINQGKLQTFAQESPNSESQGEEDAYKMAPARYKKNMPRSHYFHEQKKRQELGESNSLKYSLNFKEKLQPIRMRHESQEGDLDETKNRSSIFKRSTLKEALLRPKESLQVPSDSPPQKKRQRTPVDSQLKSSGGKEIKMRPGKLTLAQLIQYLKSLNLPQEVKNETILNQRYEESLTKCQSYLSEFLISNEVKAIGLVFALPDGDYLIKLWGPLKNCDQQTSKLLLGKFLDYIQKQTCCNNIYYSGAYKSLFLSLNFLAKNERLLFRKRISPKSDKQLQFPQFLSLKCSNLLFPQENKTVNMLYSDQIESFTDKNHYVEAAFADIDRQRLGNGILMVGKISEEIADMKALNSLLEDEQFDTYEVTSNMKISNISAIRLASCFNFRSGFLAGEGMFKLTGEEVMRKGESLICRVQSAQPNSHILLGKGFSNMSLFIEQSRKSQKKACEFTVKMFSKQLYGRMASTSSDRCSYGYWQFSLSWKDELQGRVKHSLSQLESFGPEPFFFGVQLESQLIFCFKVGSEDFLF